MRTLEASATSTLADDAVAAPAHVSASTVTAAEDTNPLVVILGGEANAISVVRDLHRLGIRTYVIAEPNSCVKHSKYSQWIELNHAPSLQESWANFLLGPDAAFLDGAVVIACSDTGLEVLSQHRAALARRFKLDICNPEAQLGMLDKLKTYRHARAIGVPTPSFWAVNSREQILQVQHELVYPLLVKPRLSHEFMKRFNRKFIVATAFDQVLDAFDTATEAGMEMMLVEQIPGNDDMLCSYYTYLDDSGKPCFNFTKRIIRRFPVNMGGASYHITDWIPEIVEPSLALLRHAGVHGLANLEFKLDRRDGTYKLIECNARFTAANCLVAASGFSLAELVYCRITGRPLPQLQSYRMGLRLWDPIRDFWAFCELRRKGQLTLWQWLKSICHRQTFAIFSWRDPGPAIARSLKPFRRLFNRNAH